MPKKKDEGTPDLVADSSSSSSTEPADYPWQWKLSWNIVRGKFPWQQESCNQTDFNVQSKRWLKLSKDVQESAYLAMRRLLVTPFLFQKLVIPEKWIRWAGLKGMMSFDVKKRRLPAGKLSRQHYIVIKLFDFGLEKLKTMADKRKTVKEIVKMMYSIICIDSKDLNLAIEETKDNETVQGLLDCIKLELKQYPQQFQKFFEQSGRLNLTVLFCLRQFAEVVHITTVEGRRISSEITDHFRDLNYYATHDDNEGRKKGNELYKKGKYQEAIKVYTDAISSEPFHYLLYSNRSQAFIKLNDYESAFSDAYRSVVLQPSFCKGYYRIVLCLNKQDRNGEALEWGEVAFAKCKDDEDTIQALEDLMDTIREQNGETLDGSSNAKRKARKKRIKSLEEQDEVDDIKTPTKDSPTDMDSANDKVVFDEETRRIEEAESREKNIALEYAHTVHKAALEFLKEHYTDACKTYKLAIDIVAKYGEVRGYTENDHAVLLYTRGVSSQRQGSAIEIDLSRHFFKRIIQEHRTFTHLCMVYYANAKSTFLLNDFSQAKKEVSKALQILRKFTVKGVLTWPGASENIPESDETVLRQEIHFLLQQCDVPPLPHAVCKYRDCSKDYTRKQIYFSDLNFEGYFEVCCDWHCILTFHLRCWAKFKHDLLNLSGDKDILGKECFTPDCGGKIMLIRMFDEYVLEKKRAMSPTHKRKEIKPKATKYRGRMLKSELNFDKYNEIRLEKKRKKMEKRKEKKDSPKVKVTKTNPRNFSEGFIAADQDLSEATIYVKDHSQKDLVGKFSRGNRRVTPASLQHFCSSLGGYERGMPMQEVNKLLEKARSDDIALILPDDLQDEIDQFVFSFETEEQVVHFSEDEKMQMPFLFEYFVYLFTDKGPLNISALDFTNELVNMPLDLQDTVGKCGGLLSFLNSSPLFIQVFPYIGIHSQHQLMKKLTEKTLQTQNHTASSTTIPRSMSDPSDVLPFSELGFSAFAKEFYQIGANVGEGDIINITGGNPESDTSTSGRVNGESKKPKSDLNSETSSMYSLEDLAERSELNSQASGEAEGLGSGLLPLGSPFKSLPSLPTQVKEMPPPAVPPMKKTIKKKFSAVATQTDFRDDGERAKEAVPRLQERVQELEDELTKIKRTYQTREESLMRDLSLANEKVKKALSERESIKQSTENEIAKIGPLKRQLQAAEAKADQGLKREKELESNLSSLTIGMQQDREVHLREIINLRKSVDEKTKASESDQKRAIKAEIDLVRTKESYHVTAHMQTQTFYERKVREYDVEINRMSSFLPPHLLQHYKNARKQWADSVVACDKIIETLKAAYSSILDQISSGRLLAELPSVPDLKPPPPGPNPHEITARIQNEGNMSRQMNGQVRFPGASGSPMMPGMNSISPSPAPISGPPVFMKSKSIPSPVGAMQAPIGAELPKPQKKKSFVQLVEKLSKNIPQLTREQLDEFAQLVRTENNGLTGLLYEQIEERIRGMAGLKMMQQQQGYGRQTGYPWDMEEEAVCPICCDPLKDGRVATLECQHKFHYNCIAKWMQKQKTCPNCRTMVDASDFPSNAALPPGLNDFSSSSASQTPGTRRNIN